MLLGATARRFSPELRPGQQVVANVLALEATLEAQ